MVYIQIELALAFFLTQLTPVVARVESRGSWVVKLEVGEGESIRDRGIVKIVRLFHLFVSSASLDPPPPPPSPVSGIDFTPCQTAVCQNSKSFNFTPCARTPNLLVYKTSRRVPDRRVPELQILYMLNFTPCARTPNLIYKLNFILNLFNAHNQQI